MHGRRDGRSQGPVGCTQRPADPLPLRIVRNDLIPQCCIRWATENPTPARVHVRAIEMAEVRPGLQPRWRPATAASKAPQRRGRTAALHVSTTQGVRARAETPPPEGAVIGAGGCPTGAGGAGGRAGAVRTFVLLGHGHKGQARLRGSPIDDGRWSGPSPKTHGTVG
jgi:hypothetical protein